MNELDPLTALWVSTAEWARDAVWPLYMDAINTCAQAGLAGIAGAMTEFDYYGDQ